MTWCAYDRSSVPVMSATQAPSLTCPSQVAAQVGCGVLAGGAFETREVGGNCQSQPVGERLGRVAGPGVSSVKVIMARRCNGPW
jgi:hypothetical protein